MTLWKQRLFFRLQRPVGDDGDDLGGEVISINGEGTADTPEDNTPEDRGDVVEAPKAPEADGADAGEPAAVETRQSGSIPKARFDEVNEKRKAVEADLARANAELAALRSKPAPVATQETPAAPAPAAFDEDAKEEAYIEAMLEGDVGKAKEIRREINAHLRQQAAIDVQTSNAQAAQASLLQSASAQAVTDFPYLDTDEGAFALGLIVAARDQAVRNGVPVHQALSDAVAKIAPRFAPAEGSTPSPVLQSTKAHVDTRTQEAVSRGAADSLKQPALVQASGIGNRADAVRVDVAKLDEDQFANLSAADKKRLRGD